MKVKVDVELIKTHKSVTAKVYIPNGPYETCDKLYFTKPTVRAAKQAIKEYLNNKNYTPVYHERFYI